MITAAAAISESRKREAADRRAEGSRQTADDRLEAEARLAAGRHLKELAAQLKLHRGFADMVFGLSGV
jgi:hypothetical protein